MHVAGQHLCAPRGTRQPWRAPVRLHWPHLLYCASQFNKHVGRPHMH